MQLRRWLPLIALLLSTAASLYAQTFRGSLTGTVVDAQGAFIPNAAVQLKNPATGSVVDQKSNNAGEFNFPELTPGMYTLTVTFSGFQTQKIDAINIEVSKVTTQKITLNIGTESTVVDVAADAIQTDTTSAALVAVIDSKSVADMPMNGRNFTQMTRFAPGANALSNSINGSRTASINFQLDGADNVDPWLGIVASNQGGIASVAGGLIPIEAIDQFSMQSGGEADQGRNAGANLNMVIKSGTNHIHGDVFYFDRNEFFAAISPVAAIGSRKPLIRNHQGGFTLGGPIWKDHTFLFLAGEIQVAKANTTQSDTVISDAWIAAGEANLAKYGVPVSQLSLNLYSLLFPANAKGGPQSTNNYLANGTANYNSFNGIIKLDHHFNDKHTLSARYLGTTGKQTAPTGSYYAEYFQTAPMHIHNISVVDSYIFTPRLVNTVTLATNYFLQTFNDADQNFNPQTNAGLNLGITNPIVAAGAPTITVTGFDITGATQPSGRTDVTGHVTDNLHYSLGRHELKFGGEYRHSNVNQLYFSSARGTFTFDGTRGPWASCVATPANPCPALAGTQLGDLSDFLAGEPTNSSGARLLQGNAQRVWTMSTFDLWAQDDFRINNHLNINYGVRYTVPGVINAEANDIYQFVPGTNPGFVKGYYPEYYGGVAPRIGFEFTPFDNARTTVRGSYGIFYDFPAMSSWVTGTTTNGGAAYAQNNPAGPDAAVIFNQSNVVWAPNVNPFVGAAAPQVGAFGVTQNFKMPRSTVVSFNVEQELTKTTLLTLGYVGTFAQHLQVLYDINQPRANGSTTNLAAVDSTARPYQAFAYPNESAAFTAHKLSAINQLNFEAASNYHSFQATLKQAVWKGITATAYYTWSKAMDDASSSTTPMNSYNLHQDYGPSTFDNRHVLNGFVYYNLPKFTSHAPRLTQGYQVNAIYTWQTGTPISPAYSTNVDGTGELKDRPDYTGVSPYVRSIPLRTSTATGRTYTFLQNSIGSPSFVCPGVTVAQEQAQAAGSATYNPSTCPTSVVGRYGNEQRDSFYGPQFRTVDFSLFKHTPITERVMSEFRVEIFNIFNFNNFANPTTTPTSSSYGIISATRNNAGSPGIGVGEPFNIQFAFKVSF